MWCMYVWYVIGVCEDCDVCAMRRPYVQRVSEWAECNIRDNSSYIYWAESSSFKGTFEYSNISFVSRHLQLLPTLILYILQYVPMSSSVMAQPSGGRHASTSAEKDALGTSNSCRRTLGTMKGKQVRRKGKESIAMRRREERGGESVVSVRWWKVGCCVIKWETLYGQREWQGIRNEERLLNLN